MSKSDVNPSQGHITAMNHDVNKNEILDFKNGKGFNNIWVYIVTQLQSELCS